MDEKRKKDIDRAFRKASRKAFFAELRNVRTIGTLALLVAVVIALIGVTVVLPATPAQVIETVEGRAEGTFLQPNKIWPQVLRVQVKLEDGRSVSMPFPKTAIFKDAPMRIEIRERRFGPLRYTDYRFAGYADEPD